MKYNNALLGVVISLSMLPVFQPAWGGDPVEDARAVFVEMVGAAKANDLEAFKSHIVAEDLAEMEKEGFTQFMMMMMAEDDPSLYTAETDGDHIVFTHEVKEESAEGSSSSKTTVHMIQSDGQWKFGKPKEAE